uniref:Uncharacterized protein n=1 Tax=Knipowitschia caucasica TaxID=637954 RepID=A0AAV2JZM2_KNICA
MCLPSRYQNNGNTLVLFCSSAPPVQRCGHYRRSCYSPSTSPPPPPVGLFFYKCVDSPDPLILTLADTDGAQTLTPEPRRALSQDRGPGVFSGPTQCLMRTETQAAPLSSHPPPPLHPFCPLRVPVPGCSWATNHPSWPG